MLPWPQVPSWANTAWPDPNACMLSTLSGATTPDSTVSRRACIGLRHASEVASSMLVSSVPPAPYSSDMNAHGRLPYAMP